MSPAGSVIVVSIRPGSATHDLVVADEGPGLDDEAKQQALTRFWRADTSGAGSGLGLAIVDAIVTAGGGSIELRDHGPTGLEAIVTVPATLTPEP